MYRTPPAPQPGVTCHHNRRLISQWLYPMIYCTVRYGMCLNCMTSYRRSQGDFCLRPLREVGSPSRNISHMKHACMGRSERATTRRKECHTVIEGAEPNFIQFCSLFPQIPKLVCPSQRPHVAFATRTNHDRSFFVFDSVFDSPDKRARRSALQTHAPSARRGGTCLAPRYVYTPPPLLPCWA